MINWDELKEVLSDEQFKVLKLFLEQGISIRSITEMVGQGRTRVNNVIESCMGINDDLDNEILLRKLNLRTHKDAKDLSEIDLTPLTEEMVKSAYVEITEGGSTLTDVASVLGKQRDTVKKAIIEYLDDDKDAIKEFKQILKDNQAGKKEARYFLDADSKTKKQMIFSKLNNRRKMNKRPEYPETMLEKKYERLREYFLKRNDRMGSEQDQISEQTLLSMLYDYPTMLALSISDKIRPMIGKLDEKYLGEANTTRLLKENPGVLGTTIRRVRLQIRMLKETDTLKYAMEKPRIFRTSPELMYAEIKHWQKLSKTVATPFMSRARLEETYKLSPEELERKYDIKKEYGDDEYFDGR